MSSDQRESKEDGDTYATVEFVTGNPQLVVLSGKLVHCSSHSRVEEGRDVELRGREEKQVPEYCPGK